MISAEPVTEPSTSTVQWLAGVLRPSMSSDGCYQAAYDALLRPAGGCHVTSGRRAVDLRAVPTPVYAVGASLTRIRGAATRCGIRRRAYVTRSRAAAPEAEAHGCRSSRRDHAESDGGSPRGLARASSAEEGHCVWLVQCTEAGVFEQKCNAYEEPAIVALFAKLAHASFHDLRERDD